MLEIRYEITNYEVDGVSAGTTRARPALRVYAHGDAAFSPKRTLVAVGLIAKVLYEAEPDEHFLLLARDNLGRPITAWDFPTPIALHKGTPLLEWHFILANLGT